MAETIVLNPTSHVHKKQDISASQSSVSQDALVYAFLLLLTTASQTVQAAQTKAKELNAARSRMSKMMDQQKSLIYSIAQHGAQNELYTVTVRTGNGEVLHWCGSKPPPENNGQYSLFGDQFNETEVALHSYNGKSMYVATAYDYNDSPCWYIGSKPLAPAGTYNAYYLTNGNGSKEAFQQGAVNFQHFKATVPVTAGYFNRIGEHDQEIEGARAYLANKVNILKQASQVQESSISTTVDMEGQIIQQGMKIASLLGSLASQISQI